jgi:hypothetical protein
MEHSWCYLLKSHTFSLTLLFFSELCRNIWNKPLLSRTEELVSIESGLSFQLRLIVSGTWPVALKIDSISKLCLGVLIGLIDDIVEEGANTFRDKRRSWVYIMFIKLVIVRTWPRIRCILLFEHLFESLLRVFRPCSALIVFQWFMLLWNFLYFRWFF